MASDMARVAGQDHGGKGGKAGKKLSDSPTNRSGMDITAAQHAAHKGKAATKVTHSHNTAKK